MNNGGNSECVAPLQWFVWTNARDSVSAEKTGIWLGCLDGPNCRGFDTHQPFENFYVDVLARIGIWAVERRFTESMITSRVVFVCCNEVLKEGEIYW